MRNPIKIHRAAALLAAAAIVAGAAAASAPAGAISAGGGSEAYGHVSTNGVLSHSKNVGNATVTKPAGTAGLYCIDGLPFTPRNVSVTLGQTTSSNGTGAKAPTPAATLGGFGCPAGTDVAVGLFEPSDSALARDHDFFFLVH